MHPLQQVDQGRLASAGGADDRHGLSRPGREGNVAHSLRGIGEIEGYVAEFHLAPDILQLAHAGRLLAVLYRILEGVEILELGAGLEDLRGKGAHLVQPADQQAGKAGKGDDVADLQLALLHQHGADH
ncbi:hypothetical protein D3C87_1700010 [compost metagenome]